MKNIRPLPLTLLFCLSGLLLGCAPAAGGPTPSPAATREPDPAASATPLPAPATRTPADPATPLPTISFLPDVYGIYGVDDGILLGGVSTSGEWISQADLSADRVIQPLTAYQQATVLGDLAPGMTTAFACPDGTGVDAAAQTANAGSVYRAHPFNALAVSAGPWPPVPEGTITWLDSPPSAYQDAARDFLAAQGLEAPTVRVRSAVVADFNGDGVNETVLEAASIQSHFRVNAGDYSVILLRRISGDAVETVPLAAEIYTADGASGAVPKVSYLTAVLDLDGDGRPEIVVDQLEGGLRRTSVYALPELEPEIVLTAGCRPAATPDRLALLDAGIYSFEYAGEYPDFAPAAAGRHSLFWLQGFPVLGGSRDGLWLDGAEAAFGFPVGGGPFQVFSKTQWERTATGVEAAAFEGPPNVDCGEGYIRLIGLQSGDEPQVALSGPWNALPRIPKPGDKTGQAYLDAIAGLREDYFEALGVVITEVYEIDLDADGTDEVVVTANLGPFDVYQDENYHLAVVLVRDGGAEPALAFEAIPLVEDYFLQAPEWSNGQFPSPEEYREPPNVEQFGWAGIFGIFDLNGDGAMEVIVRNVQEPSKGLPARLIVFELKDGAAQTLFEYSDWNYCPLIEH